MSAYNKYRHDKRHDGLIARDFIRILKKYGLLRTTLADYFLFHMQHRRSLRGD